MNPNQPDPISEFMSEDWVIKLKGPLNTAQLNILREMALRAISLEKAINNLVRDLDDQISILESRHADTGLSGPTRIGASHRARDLREWRDSVAALAKSRAAGGEETEC